MWFDPCHKKRGVSLLDQTRHKHFHFYPQVELPKRMDPPVHCNALEQWTQIYVSQVKNGGNAYTPHQLPIVNS